MTKSVRTPKSSAARGLVATAALLAAGYAYNSWFLNTEPALVDAALAADDLDTSRLPRVSGSTETYASPATTIFVTPDSVAATADALAASLTKEGWQRYEAPFSSKADNPSMSIMTFKKGAQALNVFVSLAPAQGNKTSVSYSGLPLTTDLPFPKTATEILFDPERPYLSCFTTDAVEPMMSFLNRELIARGWTPWSVKDKAKKPDGATQGTDQGMYSYFVRDAGGPVIAVVQKQKDGRTIAKIEPVPPSILTADQDAKKEPAPTPAQPSAEAQKARDAFDTLADDMLKQAQGAAAEAIAGIAKPNATKTPETKQDAGPPLAALSDTQAPIPLPVTADSVEIGDDGDVDFLSESNVQALANFYRAQMKSAGWALRPTVIDKDTMVALNFAKGDKDVSITIIQMGKSAKVSATGSGLARAETHDAGASQAAAEAAASPPAADPELAVQDVAGLPVPTPNSLSGSEKSLYRVQVNAHVPASVAAVLAFYRRELAKRPGWTENGGAVVEPKRAVVGFSTPDGPATLTLSTQDGGTAAALLVRKQVEASKAGMLPKPGKVKILLGNILDAPASITIDKQTVKISPGTGGKTPNGPTIEISPGKHTFSFKLPGQAARTDEIEVADGDIWGLLAGPGGMLALPAY